MVSNSALITVDTGPKPLHPVLWLVRLCQVDENSRACLESAVQEWGRGRRPAVIEWLRELLLHIQSQVTATPNRDTAIKALEGMIERLQQEALKTELFWIFGVPVDADLRSAAQKSSTLIRDNQLAWNALGVRRSGHDGTGRLF